jgi:hypothetical protein
MKVPQNNPTIILTKEESHEFINKTERPRAISVMPLIKVRRSRWAFRLREFAPKPVWCFIKFTLWTARMSDKLQFVATSPNAQQSDKLKFVGHFELVLKPGAMDSL